MKRDLMIQKRKKARELKRKGWGVNRIARYLMAGKDNVRRWLELSDDELEADNRGWKKGQLRKHRAEAKEQICLVRKNLEQTPGARIGADAIREVMREKYGRDVSRWFISRTLKEAKVVNERSGSPAAVGMFKREISLRALKPHGDVILLINFIKFLQGQSQEALSHFMFCRYLRPHRSGAVKMIPQRNSASVIEALKSLWRINPIPDILMMSGSDWSLGGHLPHRLRIGKLAFFLLNLGIKPLYLGGEILNCQHSIKDLPDIFSGNFIQLMTDGESEMNQWGVDDFVLQYRKGSGFSSKRIEMKNRVFKTALKYLDLDNRKIEFFLAFEILFLQVAKEGEGISVLGVHVPVGDTHIDKLLLARLDLRFQKLYVYDEAVDGEWVQIFSVEFSVQNVIYS